MDDMWGHSTFLEAATALTKQPSAFPIGTFHSYIFKTHSSQLLFQKPQVNQHRD